MSILWMTYVGSCWPVICQPGSTPSPPSWGPSAPTQLRIAAGLTRGLLEAGFRQLDTGMPVDVVVDLGEKAARGLVAGITGGDR